MTIAVFHVSEYSIITEFETLVSPVISFPKKISYIQSSLFTKSTRSHSPQLMQYARERSKITETLLLLLFLWNRWLWISLKLPWQPCHCNYRQSPTMQFTRKLQANYSFYRVIKENCDCISNKFGLNGKLHPTLKINNGF